MENINKYDAQITKLYKISNKLGIPTKYAYIDENGEIKSFLDLILNNTDLTEIKIYELFSKYETKLNYDDIYFSFIYIYNQIGEIDENVVDNINNFINYLMDEIDGLLLTPFTSLEDMLQRYTPWYQTFQYLLEKEDKIVQNIISVQENLDKLEPINFTQLILTSTKAKFTPKFEEGTEILIDDGIEIFNQCRPTMYIPYIQYTDNNGDKYNRIYNNPDLDHKKIDNIQGLDILTINNKKNIFFFHMWIGKDESDQKISDYKKCSYSIEKKKMVIFIPSYFHGDENDNEIIQRVKLSFPMLDLSIREDIHLTGKFLIKHFMIDKTILQYLVLNDELFNTYFYIDEFKEALSQKTKIILNYKSYNISTIDEDEEDEDMYNTSSVSIDFNNTKDIDNPEEFLNDNTINDTIVTIKKSKSREILDQFLVVFSRLMRHYMDQRIDVNNNFLVFIPNLREGIISHSINKKSTLEDNKRLHSKGNNLKYHFPEIFIEGYSRLGCQCLKEPIIVPDNDIEAWQNVGKNVVQFPPKGNKLFDDRTVNLVCPNNSLPNLYMMDNNLSNNKEFKYLPCCGGTIVSDNKYNNYWEELNTDNKYKKSEYVYITSGYIKPGESGTIDNKLNSLLQEYNDQIQNFGRCGVPISTSSLLHAIYLALENQEYIDEMDKETFIQNIRREIANTINMSVFRQELYDKSDDEIRDLLLNMNEFLDPYLYYRGIEEYFNINLFVFDADTLSMEIPRYKLTHIRVPNYYRQTVIILKYNNPKKHNQIHCEFIRLLGIISDSPK